MEQTITPDTTYEELSNENRAILHHVTGLSEVGLKTLSGLVQPKQGDDESPVGTKIGCVLPFIQYRNPLTYNPLPDDKRPNPLDEYIALLGISLNMLQLQNDPERNKEMFLKFRYAIKDYLQKSYNYDGAFYNGLLPLFNGSVVVDLTLFDIATRMDKSRNRLNGRIGAIFAGHFNAIKEYSGRPYKDMEQFCQEYGYIDFTFPTKNIAAFLSADENYSYLHSRITDKVWSDFNSVEKLEPYKEQVLQLINDLNGEKITNSGTIWDWKNVLSARLDELVKEIRNNKSKSRQGEYSEKMKLYLLKKIADPVFEGTNIKSPIHRLYAAILGSSQSKVKANTERLEKKNLDYSIDNYKEQAQNIESTYRLIEDIGDDAHRKKSIIDRVVQDLVPIRNTKERSLKDFEKCQFGDERLKRRVLDKINEHYEEQQENGEPE